MKIRKVGTRTATQNITQDSKPVAISVEGNVLAIVQLLVENTVRHKVIKYIKLFLSHKVIFGITNLLFS